MREEAFEDEFSRAAFGAGSVVVTTRLGASWEADVGNQGGEAGTSDGLTVAGVLAEQSRERLKELAAPVRALEAQRREGEAKAKAARARQLVAEKAAKRKRKGKRPPGGRKERKGGK